MYNKQTRTTNNNNNNILRSLKIYQIPDQVVQFIEKTMETCRVGLTAGGKFLAKVKIQRGIFQRDVLSPLLFVITMMPLSHILKKCTAEYKLSKSQEKINYLMYMDDIKLFAKNEKELQILIQSERIYSQDIKMEFGIEKCALLVMKSGKRHMIEGVEIPNQEKIKTLGEMEMKEKIFKKYLRRNKKKNYVWQNSIAGTLSKEGMPELTSIEDNVNASIRLENYIK